jgi:hypothetical protein
LLHSPCFFSFIKTNLAFVLEQWKIGRIMEDLDCLTLELEEEKKLVVVKKPRNFTKKLRPN